MATKQAPDPVQRLEQEIADWQAKRQRFAADLAAAQAAAEDAGKKREALLLAARAEGDSVAVAALDAATDAFSQAQREAGELTTLLPQIDAKLAELARALAAARRAAAAGQLRNMAVQRLALAADIEKALEDTLRKVDEYLTVSMNMSQLAGAHNLRPLSSALRQRTALLAHLARQLYLRGLDINALPVLSLNVHIGGLLANEHALLGELVNTGETAAKTAA